MNLSAINYNFPHENSEKSVKQISKRKKSPFFSNPTIFASEEKKKMKFDALTSKQNNDNLLRLNRSFFNQSCVALAKNLLGKILVRSLPSGEILKGTIVETESYMGVIDKASHSYNWKKTERNEAMFLNPGTAYVYTIYGMYYCFNISSLEDGSAVLIRAIEPLEGISVMQELRNKRRKISFQTNMMKQKELCNGPSKLCQAFQIEKNLFNKVDLCTSEDLWLEMRENIDSSSIVPCKRIGIDSYGEEWANKPLRFYVKGNSFVSRRCKTAEKIHEDSYFTK